LLDLRPSKFTFSFADRDMAMRYYWGWGVGHAYAHSKRDLVLSDVSNVGPDVEGEDSAEASSSLETGILIEDALAELDPGSRTPSVASDSDNDFDTSGLQNGNDSDEEECSESDEEMY
jgi:hypothetical protein